MVAFPLISCQQLPYPAEMSALQIDCKDNLLLSSYKKMVGKLVLFAGTFFKPDQVEAFEMSGDMNIYIMVEDYDKSYGDA